MESNQLVNTEKKKLCDGLLIDGKLFCGCGTMPNPCGVVVGEDEDGTVLVKRPEYVQDDVKERYEQP